MKASTVIFLALFAFIGYLSFNKQSLIKQRDNFKSVAAGLQTRVAGLRADSTNLADSAGRLYRKNVSLADKNGKLVLSQATKDLAVANSRIALSDANRNLRNNIATQTAQQRKELADEGGAVPTSVTDSVANGVIAEVKGENRLLRTENEGLVRENTGLKEQVSTVSKERDAASGKVSDLEKVLNGVAYSVSREFDASLAEKHFLGIGQKKSKQVLKEKVLNEIKK